MEQNRPDLLTDSFLGVNAKPRKELLPWWIKIFSWIFLVMGGIATIGLIFGVFGYHFVLEIFGFKTNDPISITGLSISVVFIVKGIASFGLLKEKDWAITVAIIDAVFSLLICTYAMSYPIIFPDSGVNFSFRSEIILIIPYLIRLIKINPLWKNSIDL